MATTTIGTIQLIASIDTSRFQSDAKQVNKTTENMEDQVDKGSQSFTRMGVVAGAAAGVISSVMTRALDAVSSSVTGAIERFDTFNNFPRVMQNLGFNIDEARGEIDELDEAARGLPTPLDQLVQSMQQISPATGSLEEARELTLGFNNALLASGRSAEDQARAMQQFTQAIGRGRPDLVELRSIAEVMPGQFRQIAQTLGVASGTVDGVNEAFKDGSITMDDFTSTIVDLNKEGAEGFASFEQQARDATGGLATAISLAQITVTRNIANIIDAIGGAAITGAFNTLADVIDGIGNAIIGSIGFIREYSSVIENVAIVIGTLLIPAVVRYIALQTVAGVQALIAGGRIAAGWLLALGPLGLIAAAVGAAVALIINNWESLREPFEGFIQTLRDIYNNVSQTLVSGFNTAKQAVTDFVNGGIAVVNSAIDSTAGFIQSVINWFVQYRQWFINIAIVAGTIFGPALVRAGTIAVVQAARAAAAWVASGARTTASFISTAAAATVNAVRSGAIWAAQATVAAARWLVQLPRIVAQMVITGVQASINALIAGAAWVAQAAMVGARWAATFAMMLTRMAFVTAQFLINAARIGAGWLLALGPIGAIIAIVVGVVALIIANWDMLRGVFMNVWNFLVGVWQGLVGFFTGLWNGVVAVTQAVFNGLVGWFSGVIGVYRSIFSAIGSFISSVFTNVVNTIRNVFNGVIGFFSGFWNTIVGLFGRIGTAVGDTIGGAVRGAINAVLNGAIGIINGFIGAINLAIDAINAIPGVDIGRLSELSVPQLADGGVVSSATLAVIGEGSEPEAVIPLSRLDEMLNSSGDEAGGGRSVTINQENNVYTELDMRQINRNMMWELSRA